MRGILWGLALVLALASLAGCGGHRRAKASPAAHGAQSSPPAPRRLALGLDENNANLLASARAAPAPPAFAPWRDALAALAPRYLRFVIDWAAVQPSPARPPQWDVRADGCLRGVAPCAAYSGVRAQLLAVASQQQAGSRVEPVITIAGVPTWAARPAGGCERSQATALSRPINDLGLAAYHQLVLSLLAEGRHDGVTLPYWSPWNEPNHPLFLSPQRPVCDASSPSLAPGVYGQLAHAMTSALMAAGGSHALLLGELAGYASSTPKRTSIGEFVAALPEDTMCLGDVWTVHDYLGPSGSVAHQTDVVTALERSLQRRGGCGRAARIWITETGTGGIRPGGPRPGAQGERAGCRTLASALARWQSDPRVDAAFQYTFRDDTAFPVGLVDARLTHFYPSYWLLRAWAQRPPDGAPPPVPAQCA